MTEVCPVSGKPVTPDSRKCPFNFWSKKGKQEVDKSISACPINTKETSCVTSDTSMPEICNATKINSTSSSVCPHDNVSQCPVQHSSNSGGCPVKGDASSMPGLLSQYNMAANDLAFDQTKLPNQHVELSVVRPVSGIPKSDFTPAHQPSGVDNWVYPSEQQYYNAMKKKGYNPNEKDVPVILQIHNMVNEQGWNKIKEWEMLRGCASPKLVRFQGRPKDVSPKAYLWSLLGYSLPFDRHDWVVDSDGRQVRYVIDFYKGSRATGPARGAPVAMFLDVRPALDDVHSLLQRISFFVRSHFAPESIPLPPANSQSSAAAMSAMAKARGQMSSPPSTTQSATDSKQ